MPLVHHGTARVNILRESNLLLLIVQLEALKRHNLLQLLLDLVDVKLVVSEVPRALIHFYKLGADA